jgi:LacI family transcriptional regulator
VPLIRPQKRVTLRGLALELGLSDRAVSQALSPRASNVKLNPETVERVQKLAREKNYRPDSRARSMRYGRFYNVGYFEAKKTPHAWPLLGAESGVFDEASDNRYRVTLIRLPANLEKNGDSIPSIFREDNLDALILSHAGNLTDLVENAIDASGFPVVYLNEKKKHNAIYADDVGGMEEMTRHMISLGHREIAYVGPLLQQGLNYSVADRRRGYCKSMTSAGLKPILLEISESNTHWEKDLSEWFAAHPKVQAVVAYSDFTALQLFRIFYRQKIRIPKMISVSGFGDDFANECAPVRLTTMKTPFYEMGRAAVKMALALIDNQQNSVLSKRFPVELVVRDSTQKIGG